MFKSGTIFPMTVILKKTFISNGYLSGKVTDNKQLCTNNLSQSVKLLLNPNTSVKNRERGLYVGAIGMHHAMNKIYPHNR